MKTCRTRVGLCALAAVVTCVHAADAELIYGLTNFQELVTFDSETRSAIAVTGITPFAITSEFLVSIDVRPATGELYGLSNQNKLYVINPTTGNSTQIGVAFDPSTQTTYASIDFNPTVDRIRLVTGAGANLRLHPDTGVIVSTDTALAFATGDANEGDVPVAVNAAYTNSFAGSTTTTLYTLDALNDILTTQVPPNNGTLNTVGALGFDLAGFSGFTGFDISGGSGIAYLVGDNTLGGGLTSGSLYTVNLATGQATAAGPVTAFTGLFRDIAVVPAPASLALCAIAGLAVCRRRR